jgi:hypothetical protein
VEGSRIAGWSIIGVVIVLVGWIGGLALWDAPSSDYPAQLPVEGFALIVVMGVPAILVGGLAIGFSDARSRAVRALGTAVWIGSSIVLAYCTSFIHFGGFCLDREDACVTRWPSRVTALILAILIVAGGSLVAAAVRRLRRPPDATSSRESKAVVQSCTGR